MSEMKVIGKVKFVGEEIQVSSSFTKRELVVTTEEQYPQHILINFTQGKENAKLDKCSIGTSVMAFINLRGREWVNPQGEMKYFNDIQGWKLEIDSESAVAAPNAPQAPGQKFVFTATDGTFEAYKAAGWSEELMVQHNKGHYVNASHAAPPQAPSAPQPAEQQDDLPF